MDRHRSTNLRIGITGIGTPGVTLHRTASRLLAMNTRDQAALSLQCFVLDRPIGSIGPDIARGVLLVDQFGQTCSVMSRGIGCRPRRINPCRRSIEMWVLYPNAGTAMST
jgi:hypothetical protein